MLPVLMYSFSGTGLALAQVSRSTCGQSPDVTQYPSCHCQGRKKEISILLLLKRKTFLLMEQACRMEQWGDTGPDQKE